ncbi:MAG: hypothetical protein FWD06_05715 [Oscillospiraceae bacterium]|nr:hypothetical protein [Oscillospiraceae bacterium]
MAKKLLVVFMAVLMLAGVFGVGASAFIEIGFAHFMTANENIINREFDAELNPLALNLRMNVNALLADAPPEHYIAYTQARTFLVPEAVALARNTANFSLLRLSVVTGQDRNPAALEQLTALWLRTINAWGELGETTSFAQAADDVRAAVLEGRAILQSFGEAIPFQVDMPLQVQSPQQESFPWLWVILGVVVTLVAVAAAAAVWFFVL